MSELSSAIWYFTRKKSLKEFLKVGVIWHC